ncbi:DUF7343 domain-containing protein [Haloterrigena alkaliphila]|uniref:IclR helix-turn-helix domain-containing protein n=1 Tax=Haloterrigena alkaliphila TaxID=2816475 RepID=A0A8A2VSA5_9EURY|nr:hypothetical protein [Haloterrigena alkaliphila]QSX00919.1 hypothetical protein J0X25_08155 [Haloterrigena alkaliphila]
MDTKGLWALVRVLVGIGCVLAVLSLGPVGAVGAVSADGAMLQEDPAGEQLSDADEIHIDVYVQENGSARFVVDYRFENVSGGEWESLREDVESNPGTYAASEERRWNEELAEGNNQTEREMTIENVSVATDTSSAPRELGHVRVTFDWTKFAYVQLNQIQVENSLLGFTFPSDTSLQINAPEGYEIDEATPEPEGGDEQSVYWLSDGDPFSSDPPMVLMIEESNESASSSPESDVESDGGSSPLWLVVPAAVVLLASAGAVGWWLRRVHGDDATTDAPAGDAVATGPTPATDSSAPPRELLSNEERVLRLLEDRGGRIKQQEVVSELDWTEAKTSQVVSGLREDGEIDVFRIGRENVLALPEEDETEV